MPGALSVAANPPRLVGWGSEPGVARASDALCRAADRLAQELHSRARPPRPSFVGLRTILGARARPAACLFRAERPSWTQNASRRLAIHPLDRTGLRAFPLQFRSATLTPFHGKDPSRRRTPAGALLSARPPDRWAPRGARQSRRTRCVSPTCAPIDLPHEHPTRTVRLPAVSRRRGEARLTALLPLRLVSLTALARAIERFTRLAPDGCSLTGTGVARCPYRRLLREAASSAPRERRFGPLQGRARLPLTPLSHPAANSRWPPGTEDRRRPPPVKEAGCSIRGAFHRTSARAFAGFCNRERFTSTAVNRLDPARARRGCPRA